jgi:hypothetical protein
MTNARTPTAHATSHQNGGSDEIATATAAAYAIPKAGSGAKLAQAWIDFTGYQTSLGYTAENQGNKSTSTSLGTSDTLYPTQNAVKTYVDSHAGSGIVNQTTGTGAPAAVCDATHNQPTASNVTVYTDTSGPAEWWCSGSAGWKKFLTADPSGEYVETGATGPAPSNPAAGNVRCYFDSSAKTQICLDENGNAFVGVKGQASRDANKFVTHITPLGIPQTAQPDWADVTSKPATFTPALPTATTLGGTKSFDCTGTGHLLKIDTTGTPTCSADAGAGGGLGDPGANGIVVRTAPGTSTNRTITGTAGQISITNGDGVSANPQIALDSAAKVRSCEIHIWGSGTGQVLQDTDDELASCRNKYGATLTVTSVECWANAGSPTVLPAVTGGANLLTGNLTCGTAAWASGTLSGSPTLAGNGTLDINVVAAGGTATNIRVVIGMTL